MGIAALTRGVALLGAKVLGINFCNGPNEPIRQVSADSTNWLIESRYILHGTHCSAMRTALVKRSNTARYVPT